MDSLALKASIDEVKAEQRKESAIAKTLKKITVPPKDRQYKCTTFGVNSMPREQDQRLERGVLGL